MERNFGSKKSAYGMLMTVLFYTTGFICSLRTAVWLAMHTLVPSISHIIALYYHRFSSVSSSRTPPSPVAGGAVFASNAGAGAGDPAGLLFKLVHTAAGHDVLVPVPAPVSMYLNAPHRATAGTTGAPGEPLRPTLARLALLSSLVGACGVAAYYYFLLCGPSAWTWGRIARSISAALRKEPSSSSPVMRAASGTSSGDTRADSSSAPALASTPTARCDKTKLNPAAPAFTPSPSPAPPTPSTPLPPLHRLDPTARAFAPRDCATPPSPADSAGPATPPLLSCMPNAFALAAARVARAGAGMGKNSGGGGVGVRFPLGVGKMRVVRPEEVVGERRAGEVFVFF